MTELCHPDACNVETTPVVDRLWAQASDLRFVLAHILAPRAWASSLPSLSENWRAFGEQSDPIEEYEQWRAAGESWSFQERWSNVRDEDRRGDAETFVDRIGRESGRNTLKFAHILLPHAPFVFLPSGKLGSLDNSMPGLIVPGDRWNEDEYAVSQVYQRHLLQVGYVDWVLGRMLRRLTEDGLLDQTLLIVTSDHGASFRAGDAFKDPTSTNVTDLMSVPLFVKYPSQADGRIDDRNAETIDILPTIADVIDIEVPWDLDGTPLTDDSAPERTRKTFVVAGGSLRMTIDPLRIHERKETIARKEALFQPGSEPWDITRLGPRSDLVGQHVLDLEVGDHSAVEIRVDHDAVFSRLRLDGDYIPSLISGSVTRDPDERAHVDLAVAVNGVIRATARSLGFSVRGRDRSWRAVVPESAFREGYNEVQIFQIASSEDGTARLLPAYRNEEAVDPDNLVRVAAEWTLGVAQQGFHGEQWHRGQVYRWTDGDATLIAPIDPDRPPAFVEVSVYMPSINPDGTRMRITVNGCRLFTRTITERRWRRKRSIDARIWAIHWQSASRATR